jgi:hypothetical protein
LAGLMALLSLNDIVVANVFIIVVQADDAAERSAVAFLSNSIAVLLSGHHREERTPP